MLDKMIFLKRNLKVSDTSGMNIRVFSESSLSSFSGLVWLKARKREAEVSVIFCGKTDTVATLEGSVRCEPGDAIVTGVHGEQWPVHRPLFETLYEPVSPALMGNDGRYRILPHTVTTARLTQPHLIRLPDNRGSLNGSAGDWLVRQRDGSLGIVASDIFAKTYDIIE